MRVCILNEFFYPDTTGGTGTVLSDLARKLHDEHSNIEIDVITSINQYRPREGTTLATTEDWDGIKITRIKTPRPNGLSTPLRLLANTHFCMVALKILLSRRYDLVIVATAPPTASLAVSIYKALTGVPYVYIVYDLEPDRAVVMNMLSAKSPVVGILKSLQKSWLDNAELSIVLGRCMKQYIGKKYDLPQSKFAVIPIGADASEIIPLNHNTHFRRKNAINGFTLLYSGNFGRYHDFNTVLDTAKRLLAIHSDITFVLVGAGVQKKHIEERVHNESIRNVRLFDFVDKEDYPDLLASADVSLVTLEPGMEGICVPSKFYSILASGRPTIGVVPEESEIGYVLDESKCGIRVNHGDIDGLMQAILTLSRNNDLCKAYGENARRVLEDEYAAERIVEKYYRSLLSILRDRVTWSSFAKTRTIRWSRTALSSHTNIGSLSGQDNSDNNPIFKNPESAVAQMA